MCGRYVIAALPEELFGRLRLEMPADFQPRFNVAPTQHAPIIRIAADGSLVLRDHRWGLVPSWASDITIGNRMINARSESASIKPAFKDALQHRRCLVPATGFYEWQKIGSSRQPFLIHRPQMQPFVFAGLWETWRDRDAADAPPLDTFTILTCAPGQSIADLHDRMPVVLHDDAAIRQWLDPQARITQLSELMRPVADDLLELHPVSRRVNKPQNDDASLIDPIKITDLNGTITADDEPTLFG